MFLGLLSFGGLEWLGEKMRKSLEFSASENSLILSCAPVMSKKMTAGEVFHNVYNTRFDKPSKEQKAEIGEKGKKKCCFCPEGSINLYSGLLHVVSAKAGDSTKTYWLAPGCQACNKSLSQLTLRKDTTFLSGSGKQLVTKQVWVMQYD